MRSTDDAVVAENDDWSTESTLSIRRASALVGAFPLPEASPDAALICELPPGIYVAQVSSADGADSGEAMIEIYLLP